MKKLEADYYHILKTRIKGIKKLARLVRDFKQSNHLGSFSTIWDKDIETMFLSGEQAINEVFRILEDLVNFNNLPTENHTKVSFLNVTLDNHQTKVKGMLNDEIDAINSRFDFLKKALEEESEDFFKKLILQVTKK